MARIEHYYDPNSPTANSIVVAATAFVQDDQGRVLLQRRTDNDLWALPGGTQDIGETLAQTVVREVLEETGITVEVLDIVGIYSNPNHVIEYSDGEVRQQFNVCFRARRIAGELAISDESSDVRWVPRDELHELAIHESMRLRIDHGLEHRPKPYIG